MQYENPDRLMVTLHTYTSPAGKTFPVVMVQQPRNNPQGKAICLAVGGMPLELAPHQLTLGATL